MSVSYAAAYTRCIFSRDITYCIVVNLKKRRHASMKCSSFSEHWRQPIGSILDVGYDRNKTQNIEKHSKLNSLWNLSILLHNFVFCSKMIFNCDVLVICQPFLNVAWPTRLNVRLIRKWVCFYGDVRWSPSTHTHNAVDYHPNNHLIRFANRCVRCCRQWCYTHHRTHMSRLCRRKPAWVEKRRRRLLTAVERIGFLITKENNAF